MLRFATLAVVVCALALSAANVLAQDAPAKPKAPAGMGGVIKSVDLGAKSFVLEVKKGEAKEDVTVEYTDATVFMLDGAESTAADALKVGARARVAKADGAVSKVAVMTKPAAKPAPKQDKPAAPGEAH